MIVVFNSSPLIFLAKLGFLDDFLDRYEYDFYTTASVVSEIKAKNDEASQQIQLNIEMTEIRCRV